MRRNGTLRIGQLADAVGVGVETIRYYERRGLLPEPPRSSSGYRRYPREAVDRLRFVRRAKELGFSLREIGELLDLRAHERDQCAEVQAQIDVKMRDLDQRIADLRAAPLPRASRAVTLQWASRAATLQPRPDAGMLEPGRSLSSWWARSPRSALWREGAGRLVELLVVEDDPTVREVARRILAVGGHTVEIVEAALEAR